MSTKFWKEGVIVKQKVAGLVINIKYIYILRMAEEVHLTFMGPCIVNIFF
jgi:hypothetical protein